MTDLYSKVTPGVRRLGFLFALGVLFHATGITSASVDSLQSSFQSPAKSQRPFVRWWWPGGDVDDAHLAGQLRAFDEIGFGGVEIQPFLIGLPMDKVMAPGVGDRINDYATPNFFAHVASASKTAQELGLTLDYTLGSAWPSGGVPEVTPALAQRELSVSYQTVRGPGPFAGKILLPARHERLGTMMDRMAGGPAPEVMKQIQEQERLVAVLAYRGKAPTTKPHTNLFGITDPDGVVEQPGELDPESVVVLTERIRADGTLDWTVPGGEWQLLVFKQFVADIRVAAGAGGGTKYVLDHLNRDAFEVYAERVFGGGREQLHSHLGGTMRALFVDSLELEVDTYWSDNFLAEFKRRRGYDLVPMLPAIVVPGWEISYLSYPSRPMFDLGDAGERVRADYRLTLSELMLENFYQPLEEYARQHGLVSRVQVHGAPVDLLRGYGIASIPETESMTPETSPRDVDLLLARSAASIYGRKLVAAESLCWKGNPFAPTPEMWKRRVDFFFVLGVNQLVFHGAPYPYLDDARPGWHPFMAPYDFSSFFSQDHPYWSHLGPLNRYVARLQSVLRETKPAVPIAVYRADLSGGVTAEPRPEQAVADALNGAGYLCDLINADGLVRSRVENGQLLTPGGTAYRAVVVPGVTALRIEVAEKIALMAKAGVPVVFTDGEPTRYEGWLDHKNNDARVRAAMAEASRGKSVRSIPAAELVKTLGALSVSPNLLFRDGSRVPFIEKRTGERRVFFLYNPEETARQVVFDVAAQGGAERWDPWSGAVSPQPVEDCADGARVDLTLDPGESVLLVFDPHTKQVAPEPKAAAESRVLPIGANGWDFRGEGYGKDGRSIDVTERFTTLADWTAIESLKDLAGNGTYSTTFDLDAEVFGKGRHVILDLGTVHDLAAVKINGASVATLLIRPFAADITSAIRPGGNTLEVTVANSPNNAMVGRNLTPLQPGMPAATYSPIPAGLLGPVTIHIERPHR